MRVSVSNRASFPLRDVVRGSVSLQKHRDRVKSMGSTNYLRRENLVNLIPQTSTNSRVNFYLADDASLCNRATLTELAIDQSSFSYTTLPRKDGIDETVK